MSTQTIPHAPGASTPDIAAAKQFLNLLDPTAEFFTWQYFSDDKSSPTAGNFSCKLDDALECFEDMQSKGCGIFYMVNAGDGKGRSAVNVVRLRAIWVDWDAKLGEPTPPSVWPIEPSIVIESSPGKFHYLWLLRQDNDLSAAEHKAIEVYLRKFGNDKSANDACRVLRLPGLYHLKDPNNPFMTRIVSMAGYKYTGDEVRDAFPPVAQVKILHDDPLLGSKPEHLRDATGPDIGPAYAPITRDDVAAMLKHVPLDESYGGWLNIGMALHSWDDDAGLELWHDWSRQYGDKYNEQEINEKWRTFKAKPGGVTIATIARIARDNGYTGTTPYAQAGKAAFERTEPNAPGEPAFKRTEPNEPGDCLRDHHCLTLAQLLALPPPPPAIYDGYYRLGEVTVVIGASSVGKTTMLMRDAFEIAQSGRTVITVSAEDEAPNYARKLAALAILDGCTDDAALQRVHCFTSALRQLIILTKTGADPNVPEFQRLAAALRPFEPSVVMLETASSLGTGEETNGQLAALAKGLILLARDLKAAVVISHHTNKQAALNADISQHAARGGSSFTANTRETINIVKPTSEEVPSVMAQYRLPASYGAKYAFDEQAFKDGRVILAHHAKCANGPETPPRGYLRVSISHGVERSFAPVSGALIRLERLDDGTAAHNRIIAGRQADEDKRTRMHAAIRAWIQNSRAAGEPTYAYSPRQWPAGDPRLCGFSGRAIFAEIEVLLLEGKLKKRPAPKPKQPKLEELCLPEEAKE
jgi:hypothetical protein